MPAGSDEAAGKPRDRILILAAALAELPCSLSGGTIAPIGRSRNAQSSLPDCVDLNEIDPRRNRTTLFVTSVPDEIVNTGTEDSVGQPTHPATGEVVDTCLNRIAIAYFEADERLRRGRPPSSGQS